MAVANPIPPDSVAPFLRAAKKAGPRDFALCLAGVSWGFRIMELLRLKVGDVADNDGRIRGSVTVQRANLKGGRSATRRSLRSRTVPVPEALQVALHDYLFSRFGSGPLVPTEPLFAGRFPGQPLCCRQAYRYVQAFAHAAGLSPDLTWSCHSLRKTYAGAVYTATGFDIIKTQRALGHANVMTTQRYLPMPESDVQAAIMTAQARMTGPLAPAPGQLAAAS